MAYPNLLDAANAAVQGFGADIAAGVHQVTRPDTPEEAARRQAGAKDFTQQNRVLFSNPLQTGFTVGTYSTMGANPFDTARRIALKFMGATQPAPTPHPHHAMFSQVASTSSHPAMKWYQMEHPKPDTVSQIKPTQTREERNLL